MKFLNSALSSCFQLARNHINGTPPLIPFKTRCERQEKDSRIGLDQCPEAIQRLGHARLFLLAAILWLGCIPSILARKYGWPGFVGGFAIGIVLFGLAYVSLFFAKRAWYSRFPPFRLCKHGKCNTYDFRYVKAAQQGKVYVCRCGDNMSWKMDVFLNSLRMARHAHT